MKFILNSSLFPSLKGIHKLHFLLLLAGFIILILQIIYGYLTERQLYFEPEPWIKIPLPDLDNKQELTWKWRNPRREPYFFLVFLINILPIVFTFVSSLAFRNNIRKKRDLILRVLLIFSGILTCTEMYFILTNSIEPPGYGWYQKLLGGDSLKMQSLKATQWWLYFCFTCWTIIILVLSIVQYLRKKSTYEKPPVSAPI